MNGGQVEGSQDKKEVVQQQPPVTSAKWGDRVVSFSSYLTGGAVGVIAAAVPIIFLCAHFGAFKGLGTVTSEMIKYGSGSSTGALVGLGAVAGIDHIIRENIESKRQLQEDLGNAIDGNDPGAVKRYLEAGADLKHKSPNEKTVFDVAITPRVEQFEIDKRERSLLRVVISSKIGYFERRWMEKSGILFVTQDSTDRLLYYLERCKPEDLLSVDQEGNTILHQVMGKDPDFARALTSYPDEAKENVLKSLVTVKNKAGQTPLDLAVEKKNVPAFEFLLDTAPGQKWAQKQPLELLAPLLIQGGKASLDFIKRYNLSESQIKWLCDQSISNKPTAFAKGFILYMLVQKPAAFLSWIKEENNREVAAKLYQSKEWDSL